MMQYPIKPNPKTNKNRKATLLFLILKCIPYLYSHTDIRALLCTPLSPFIVIYVIRDVVVNHR